MKPIDSRPRAVTTPAMRRALLLALSVCVFAGACKRGSSAGGAEGQGPGPTKVTATVFVTTELFGTIEPCGCNSDPRGDLARAAAVIDRARTTGHVLYIDGGSLLFAAEEIPPQQVTQAKMTADLIRDAVKTQLKAAAIGLGPGDLSLGKTAVTVPRQAANISASAGIPLAPPEVIDVGKVRVGVFGVVDPDLVAGLGVAATDPAAAAAGAVKTLNAAGAQVIIALAHMDRAGARKLATAVAGIDFIVAGQSAPDPKDVSPAPEHAGDTWIVQPANRGQGLARIDLTVAGDDGAFADAIGKARARAEIADLGPRIDELATRIAGWEKDPTADPAFLDKKRAELAVLEQKRAHLQASPLAIPDHGNYFVLTQVPITRQLACDPEVQAAKIALDKNVGKANLEIAKNDKPAPAAPGQASYVGSDECSYCHAEAVTFWRSTRHAHAWETLEEVGKEFSYNCIGCHVTGWQEPGGSTLAFTDKLRDVQCEVCHGPGSLHVAANGKEKPKSLTRVPPKSRCMTCHTEDHSDTFQYEAYLRDVTGGGHGQAFRKKLGDGPTGHELRAAKKVTEVGAGCTQ